jgi:polysaccharide pyruvyl transferase WcaK-like protein
VSEGRSALASTPRLPGLVLVGFQGFGNVGDEAILCGLERVVSGAATFDAVVAGTVAPVWGAPMVRRVHPWKLLPTPAALRLIRRSDGLLISGGGLVHDYWPLVIPRYLAWVLAARLMGRPVVWAGVGVGPVRRTLWRILAGIAFALSSSVIVRDRVSEIEARRFYPAARVVVAADPAFAMEGVPRANRSGVGIIARSPAPGDERHLERLVGSLAGTVQTLRDRGVPVDILTMHPAEDGAITTVLIAALREAGSAVEVRALPADPNEAVAALGAYAVLVSTRLHGLILGAIVGVPSVPIVYDAKVAAAAELLGLSDVAIPLSELTAARIGTAINILADPGRAERLAAAVREQRRRLAMIRDTITGLAT